MAKIYHAHLFEGLTPGLYYPVNENFQEYADDLDEYVEREIEECNRLSGFLWAPVEGLAVAGLPPVPVRIVRATFPDVEYLLAFYIKED